MRHEKKQEAKLGRAEFERQSSRERAVCRRVELKPAEHDGLARQVRRTPSQHGAHAGNQLLGRKWLGYIVVRAGIQSLDLVLFEHARSQHDDGDVARAFVSAKLLRQRDAGLARQHPVKNDQVRKRSADERLGLFCGGCAHPQKSGVPEVDHEQLLNRRLVLDDQNRRCHLMAPLS